MIELGPGRLQPYYEALAATAVAPTHDPRSFELDEIILAPAALDQLAELTAAAPRVVIVQDTVAMYRRGVAFKPWVEQALRRQGAAVVVVTLAGAEVHTEASHIATVRSELRPGDTVVALGSGVVADITKHAVYEFEQAAAQTSPSAPTSPATESVVPAGASVDPTSCCAASQHPLHQAGSCDCAQDDVDPVTGSCGGARDDVGRVTGSCGGARDDVAPAAGRLRLIVAQTANSVCAYTSGMAVVTIDGVKRTLASRLPDVLLLDTQVLADAPAAYARGGIGDASVAAVSFADYRLSHLLGLSRWEPLAWDVMVASRARLLRRDPILADRGQAGMAATAIDLAACGLAMTVAGESAPLSGLEHVTSHTLDMAAARHGRPIGNHGSQCALATILSLIAWDHLLSLDELPTLDLARIDPAAEQAQVERAFGFIDTAGSAWRECWRDYAKKITTWRDHQSEIAAFAAHWPEQRADLRRFVTPPDTFVAALAAAGHPLRWEEIPTGLDETMARWGFSNARLMRQRTSVADILGFAGCWTEALIDHIFTTYHQLISPYQTNVTG